MQGGPFLSIVFYRYQFLSMRSNFFFFFSSIFCIFSSAFLFCFVFEQIHFCKVVNSILK